MKKIFVLLMMALATCNISAKSNFVQVKDGHFVRDGKPYYYVGTNFWYGAILGSEGQGGNRERLCKELDKMKEMGIEVVNAHLLHLIEFLAETLAVAALSF